MSDPAPSPGAASERPCVSSKGSPKLDFGLFVIQPSNGHGVETLAKEMVGIAAEGIVGQIQGKRSLASIH